MKVQSNCSVGTVFESQAKRLGVEPGWVVVRISGLTRTGGLKAINVSNSKEVFETIKTLRNDGCSECKITFNTISHGKPAPVQYPAETVPTDLDPVKKNAAIMAGAWFFLKLVVGKTANEWLSSILAFSICGVVSSTVGFDVAMFFGGAIATVTILKILELFFGHTLYDLIVLGLICAYHTKPDPKTFDGKPMRERIATQKEIKAKVREENGEPPPPTSEPTDFLGQLWKGGTKFVKEVATNVVDASVPIVFRDFYVLVVAEAQFSKSNVDENVFYVGCFNRWFNVQAQFTTLIIKAHSFMKKLSEPQPK